MGAHCTSWGFGRQRGATTGPAGRAQAPRRPTCIEAVTSRSHQPAHHTPLFRRRSSRSRCSTALCVHHARLVCPRRDHAGCQTDCSASWRPAIPPSRCVCGGFLFGDVLSGGHVLSNNDVPRLISMTPRATRRSSITPADARIDIEPEGIRVRPELTGCELDLNATPEPPPMAVVLRRRPHPLSTRSAARRPIKRSRAELTRLGARINGRTARHRAERTEGRGGGRPLPSRGMALAVGQYPRRSYPHRRSGGHLPTFPQCDRVR